MDNYTSRFKARLGFFITGGLALFVIAIFIIGKQQNLFNPVFRVSTNFYNVSGLQVGNNIRFSGINVGTVNNIMIINDSTVQVEMLIRKNVQQFIKADSQAGIGSEGIIGDRVLIITQGSDAAPIVKDGQHILSKEPVETDAIMASLQTTAVIAEGIAQQISEIMININSGQGALGRLIQDSTIAENINQTIANFKKSSEGLDETIEVTKENLFEFMEKLQLTAAKTEENVLEFMEKLQLTAAKTEIASNELGEIMLKISSGKGTLGMLIQDTIFAGHLNQTIINLKQSSHGLDENIEALKHNIFFRRYFKRKAKREEQERIDAMSENAVKGVRINEEKE